MKVPVSWLKEYVDFDDSTAGLCEKLTFSGIEVEGVNTIGGDLAGVVVGQVTSIEPHPGANRLRLCTVDLGTGESRVVCGAPNVQIGGKYPFAPVGVTLPNGVELKKKTIRGEASEGMLCAEDELGVSDKHQELMVLDRTLEPGTPLAEILGDPEVVLDLEITPNRPDSLSLIGVAREVACLYGTQLKLPDVTFDEEGLAVEELTRVHLDVPEDCPRYTARVLYGLHVGPSPAWIAQRLQLAGVRPINNIVDITNYVMLETGQPLHAFDKALLSEERVIVRRARSGEKITTLDNEERELDEDIVVIADALQAVALAGVMGGGGSEISASTSTVLLESACFKPSRIRSTASRLGLSTESSYRFERGIDVDGVEWASRRAAALMVEYANARVAPGVIDVYAVPIGPCEVRCRYERIRSLIGLAIDRETIHRIFTSLGLRIANQDGEGCTVSIPTFRGDLKQEVDLIEEVARIHGLDRIPSPAPHSELVPDAYDTRYCQTVKLRDRLVGLGLREILNYSFVSSRLLDLFEDDKKKFRVTLPNPLSQDQSVMRTSLVPQVVESLGRNANRQIKEAAFFEIGRTYRGGANGEYLEIEHVAFGLLGPVGRTRINKRSRVDAEEMFLVLKGIWESLSSAQRVDDLWTLTPAQIPALRTGYAVSIVSDGREIGSMGVLNQGICENWRISEPVGVLEVEINALLCADEVPVRTHSVPSYPSISRDAALIVDAGVTHQDILNIVRKVAPKELEKIELFDIFTSEKIGSGKKSLAYTFEYRSPVRTLTDAEANQHHDRVKEVLQSGLHAEIRDH